MANRRVRHLYNQPHIFMKGEPPTEINRSLYITEGDGYWLQAKKHLSMQRERRQKEREERRARRPLRGPGSGREGGGRGAAHGRFHFRGGELNWDTKPVDCPICLSKKLWKIWKQTDYGQLPGWLDTLKPKIPRVVSDKKRPGELRFTKVPKPPRRDLLELCDAAFDRYMRGHRFEHFHSKVNIANPWEREVLRWEIDYDIFLLLGIPGKYERPSTHGGVIPTNNHIPIERFDRLLTA